MATLSNLVASLSVDLSWSIVQDVDGLATPLSASEQYGFSYDWSYGSSTGQAGNVYFALGVIPGGSQTTIDLFNLLVPQSNFNLDLSFATVKACIVELIDNDEADGTNSSSIRIGNAATNRWDGWLQLGGMFTVDQGGAPFVQGSDSGRAVNAGARNLKIANLDLINTATVRVTVYGIQNGF